MYWVSECVGKTMELLSTGTNESIFAQYQNLVNYGKKLTITSKVDFTSSLTSMQLQYFSKHFATDADVEMVMDDGTQQELESLRSELKSRITALDINQARLMETEQALTTLSNQIQTLLQQNRQLEETLQREHTQWQYKENSYLNIVNAAKNFNEQIRRQSNEQTQQRQTEMATTAVSRTTMPKLTITEGTFEENFRNIDNLSEAFSSFDYNAIQLFETVDNMVSSGLAEFIFRILLTTTGISSQSNFSFSPENLKILIIMLEGALRSFPDTAIDEAIDYIRKRLHNNQYTFRDPMFLATRHVPNSLQSLIFSNLTSMYRQKFDIMPTVSSMDLFKRHIPVTGLNTFRYDPNNAKTSIFIYEAETRNNLRKR